MMANRMTAAAGEAVRFRRASLGTGSGVPVIAAIVLLLIGHGEGSVSQGGEAALKELGIAADASDHSPFIRVDREPRELTVDPFDLSALGATAAVRLQLSRDQDRSLATTQPILRFEFVDASPKVLPMLYERDGKAAKQDGFDVTALVYRGTLAQGSIPARARRVEFGSAGGRVWGPTFDLVRVESVLFEVRPADVNRAQTRDSVRFTLGSKGWHIAARRRLGLAIWPAADVPIYDVSALRLRR